MEPVVAFSLEDGGTVLVEAVGGASGYSGDGLDRAGARGSRAMESAAVSLRQALDTIRETARTVARTAQEIDSQPDEFEVSFGVQLSAALNAGILTSGGASHLNVRILWRPGHQTPAQS